jgi:hypothetical protein
VTGSRLQPHENAAGRVVSAAARASTVIAEARQELDAVERELSRFSDATVGQIRQSGAKLRFVEVHRSANDSYLHTWYRKKTGTKLQDLHNVHLGGWIPQATPAGHVALAPFATSTVLDTTPQACWAWAIPPWLRLPDDTCDAPALRAQLGTTSTTGSPHMPTVPYPGPHLRPDAVLTTPWRHAPLVGEPTDAVDLAYWYHRSAWVQQWHQDQTPVPFWLPAEHAVAYPQARSLPADTDIRLPYPVIFAAFAAPWQIEGRAGELPAALATAQLLMLYARGHAAKSSPANLATHLARLQTAQQPFRSSTWTSAMSVVLDRDRADLAGTHRLGLARLESAVRRELIRRGKQKPCLRIVRALFTALTDPAGVIAHRRGALERVALLLGDWLETHRRLLDTEHRMTAILDELELTELVTSIVGLSAIGAAAILAETGDPNRFATARALVKHAGLAPREKTVRQLHRPHETNRARTAQPAAGAMASRLGRPTRQPGLRRPVRAPDQPTAEQPHRHSSPGRDSRGDPAATARRHHHRATLGPSHRRPRHQTSRGDVHRRLTSAGGPSSWVGASPTRH